MTDMAPGFAALQQAADWYAQLHAPDVSDAGRARWRAWLAADVAHSAAWARVEAISCKFERIPGNKTAARKALDDAAVYTQQRRQTRRGSLRLLSAMRGYCPGRAGFTRMPLAWAKCATCAWLTAHVCS